MATKKIDPAARANTAKKAAALKVEKAKKPIVTPKSERITRDEAAKRAFKKRIKP